jgi:hypothetical protein
MPGYRLGALDTGMDDRSLEYRALAAECVKLARSATDANRRSEYLALAQMWTELAKEAARGARALNRAEDEFNNAQITKAVEAARPVQQQQQQIQPKKRGS